MIVADDDYFRQRSSRSPDERSDIRVFGAVPHIALMSFVKWFAREISPPCDFAGENGSDDRATVEAKPEDVGDQALIRGFKPQFRGFVRGCPLSTHGRRSTDRPQSDIRNSPAVASPPPLHDICPGCGPGIGSLSALFGAHFAGVAGSPTARLTAQMKPDSSRAIAVTTRVGRLPRRANAR